MNHTLPALRETLLKGLTATRVEELQVSRHLSPADTWKLARKLKQSVQINGPPELILFLDVFESTESILRIFSFVFANRPWPKLTFFTFGNFLSQLPLWGHMAPSLAHREVQFLVTSAAQAAVLRSCIKMPEFGAIGVCPVPIVSAEFNSQTRRQWRAELGIGADEILAIYAGRLAFEKNIPALLEWIQALAEVTPRPLRLIVFGEPDDENGGLLRGVFPLGSQYHTVAARNCRGRNLTVEFRGAVSADCLPKINMAADIALTMSHFHEEEYGLSIRESWLTGCQVVVSRWGGHKDLIDRDPSVFALAPKFDAWRGWHYTPPIQPLPFCSELERQALSRRRIALLRASAEQLDIRAMLSLPGFSFSGFTATKDRWSALRTLLKSDGPLVEKLLRWQHESHSILDGVFFDSEATL